MNGFLRLLLASVFVMTLGSCASEPIDEGNDAGLDGTSSSADSSDFDDFDNPDEGTNVSEDGDSVEQSLEQELNAADGAPEVAEEEPVAPAETDEFAEFENEEQPALPEQGQEILAEEEVPPPAIEEAPPIEEAPAIAEAPVEEPPVEEAPVVEEPLRIANIKNIRYKANDNGGTVVIDADGPLTYNTRLNSETNQFVIEIPDANLPAKLKRPFNTKDMSGSIGSIDAYQNKGSKLARVVVQLRGGANEPVVQSEGNSLLVVASGAAPSDVASGSEGTPDIALQDGNETAQTQILSSQSLEEYLSDNSQFFGRKISIETSEMDIKEVFKLISEESGINMVVSDDIKGTISLKLREVPWDQAMVVIMKSKKLGYTRNGTVLRVAPLTDIRQEEDDALKLVTAKKALTPLKVRMLPVSYAKIDEIVGQVKPFLSDRGKVVGDVRTSALVISDVDENMERVIKLVQGIDVPPPQVLIEGKIIEATDSFTRNIGVNWSSSGRSMQAGYSRGGPIRGQTQIGVSPGTIGATSLNLGFTLGSLDVLGDLSARLALFEQENLVKVLSSPRIVTLHNEAAEINQTTEIPLITSNVVAGGSSSQSVTFKPIRLKLSVTPQITNDAAVIMAVDVMREFAGPAADTATQARAVNSRQAKTKVLVKNGQTAVIGGIYQSDMTQGETKVPWLGDIPVFGWLFKSRVGETNKNELLIFLTPRIMGQADSQAIPSSMGGGSDEF